MDGISAEDSNRYTPARARCRNSYFLGEGSLTKYRTAPKKYLSENSISNENLSLKQFPSGYSNLTYFLESSSKQFVLRRPPFGAKSLQGGHESGARGAREVL